MKLSDLKAYSLQELLDLDKQTRTKVEQEGASDESTALLVETESLILAIIRPST